MDPRSLLGSGSAHACSGTCWQKHTAIASREAEKEITECIGITNLSEPMTQQFRKDDCDTPSLLVDLERMERNVQSMADFTKHCSVNLRPHVKTHKVPELAKMQLDAGANGVCVQKASEAEVFADAGITDI